MRGGRGLGVAVLLALGLMSLTSRDAVAIPAFARAYRLPCSSCHDAISRRSEFGDAFRKAGYRWPGEDRGETFRTEPIEMEGAAALSGRLLAEIPIGISLTLSGSYASDAEDELRLGTPGFNVLFGSTLGQHFSVFGTWAGGGVPNELYVHVARLFGRRELNLRLGQLEQTTTLFKNNEALVGRFALASSSLNGFSVGQGRSGAEANGILFDRTFWAAGAVFNDGVIASPDAYYHVSHKLGGMDLLGEEPDIDLDEPSAWDDLVLTVGHWGYWGTTRDPVMGDVARIRRLGVDSKLRFGRWSMWTGAMLGLDRDLMRDLPSTSITLFGELSVYARSWLMPMYLVQYQESAAFAQPYLQHDVGLVVLAQENIRIRVSGTYRDDGVDNEGADAQVLIGF